MYEIIDDGLTQVMSYDYEFREEFSVQVAYEHRTKKSSKQYNKNEGLWSIY